jgi:hypothetical protein
MLLAVSPVNNYASSYDFDSESWLLADLFTGLRRTAKDVFYLNATALPEVSLISPQARRMAALELSGIGT